MKGFKDTTKMQYARGGRVEGYAKGGKTKGAAKISTVMREFKEGKLHSGSKEGPKVKSRKQAVAIALNEAGKSKPSKKVVRKQEGGAVGRANRTQREEAREEAKLMREVPARPTRGNLPDYTAEPAEARRARRDAPKPRRAAPTPTPAPAPRRGPAGAGFSAKPMYEINTGPSPSGMDRLRFLEDVARAVLPRGAERGLENMGVLPRTPRRPR